MLNQPDHYFCAEVHDDNYKTAAILKKNQNSKNLFRTMFTLSHSFVQVGYAVVTTRFLEGRLVPLMDFSNRLVPFQAINIQLGVK